MRLANQLFGGTRAVLHELEPALDALRASHGNNARAFSLLDVGTGLGDIPARARMLARRRRVTLVTFGLDASEVLARAARTELLPTTRGDALQLPHADHSIDIVMCSQLLHHFDRDRCIRVLRELDRVARRRVIVSDLRRSWLAAGGIWLASWVLRFHPVSRHDGVLSVFRGFTKAEMRELVRTATGHTPAVRWHAGFRLSASWVPQEVI